jgi:hypothetical protein
MQLNVLADRAGSLRPAGIVGKGARVWRWADVRPWLVKHSIADPGQLSDMVLQQDRWSEARPPAVHVKSEPT